MDKLWKEHALTKEKQAELVNSTPLWLLGFSEKT